MLKCSAPGCPNLVPSTVDIVRGASLTMLCAFHAAEITEPEPQITAQPNPWLTDPLAALRDAMPALERVRAWNEQVRVVADQIADEERAHGLIIEMSAESNTVTARENAILARDEAYIVDLDLIAINRATLNLTDIPFTTREDRP